MSLQSRGRWSRHVAQTTGRGFMLALPPGIGPDGRRRLGRFHATGTYPSGFRAVGRRRRRPRPTAPRRSSAPEGVPRHGATAHPPVSLIDANRRECHLPPAADLGHGKRLHIDGQRTVALEEQFPLTRQTDNAVGRQQRAAMHARPALMGRHSCLPWASPSTAQTGMSAPPEASTIRSAMRMSLRFSCGDSPPANPADTTRPGRWPSIKTSVARAAFFRPGRRGSPRRAARGARLRGG